MKLRDQEPTGLCEAGMGLGLDLSLSGGGVWSPLNLFAGGAQGGWWDLSDTATLFQDTSAATPVTASGQPLGRVNDKSGRGNNLLCPDAGTSRSTWQSGSGLYWAAFDGSNDYLNAVFASTAVFTRISAVRLLSDAGRFFSGGNAQAGELIADTLPGLSFYSGSVFSGITGPASGADAIIVEVFNGASSFFQLNGGAKQTGNPGSTNPGGVTVGALSNGAGFFAFGQMRLYSTVMIAGVLSDADIARVTGL